MDDTVEITLKHGGYKKICELGFHKLFERAVKERFDLDVVLTFTGQLEDTEIELPPPEAPKPRPERKEDKPASSSAPKVEIKFDKREEKPQNGMEKRKLSRAERISLFLILTSVVLWFMGYNAVTTKYSVYAGTVLNVDYNTTLLIAQAAAVVSYLPVGILSSKLGRKKMILAGIIFLSFSP